VTAAVGLPVLLWAVYVGGLPYVCLAAAVAVLAYLEAARLQGAGHGLVSTALGVCGTLVWLLAAASGRWDLFGPLFGVFLGIVLARQVLAHPAVKTGETAAILLSSAYAGFTLGHFPALRRLPDGFMLTMTAFLLTWTFDCAAYFVGRAVGRRKLAPRLSPGKTQEGALAGTIGVLAVAAIPWRYWPVPVGARIAAAAIVIVAGQFGDLWESSMKRFAGVKDSGRLLPGHGGILDRFDSLMFVVPAAYYLFAAITSGVRGG
jgi:phosphatidate cytidylyltransferase